MDSTLTLALMMKAKIVFERDSNFLCFPVSPISYTRNDLSFVLDTSLSAVDLTNLSSFSSLVNLIPDGVMWPPADEKYLWDAYSDVLKNADYAESTRTPDEDQQYRAASAFLYSTDANGLRTPSPQLVAYQQYRDADIVAQQNYATAKNTADTTTDPAVQSQWATQGPALLQAVADADATWTDKGYKDQVGEALATVQRLGAKSPYASWQQWMTQFDPRTSALVDGAGQQFYPSAPSPVNVFEEGAVWQQFTLLGTEADALVKQAPADLQSRLGTQLLDISIQKVSFEYTSVAIKRAWFDPQLFAQRFWRFGDAGHLVSDGQTLNSGTCPAYVVAAVFIRNVQLELAPDPQRNGPILARVQAGNALNFGFFTLRPPATPTATVASGPPVVRPLLFSTIPHPVATMQTAMVQRPAPPPPSPARQIMYSAPPARPIMSPAFATLSQARMVQRIPAPAPAPPSGSSAQTPAPPPPPPPDLSMHVLGFICKRVPKSPDPDQTLSWTGAEQTSAEATTPAPSSTSGSSSTSG